MQIVKDASVVCIIVNWNGWADTIKCIESLAHIDYDSLSVLLVDNGSTDDSVIRIRTAFPNLEIIESCTNLGFGGGNNLGIRQALQRDPKYLWLLNNDTVVEPGTLAALVAAIQEDRSLGAVGSVLRYAHAPELIQAWGGGHINLWTGTSRHFHSPVPCDQLDYLTAASILIRTEVLEQVGIFDEQYFMYWEDTDLCFRIRRAGWRLAVAEKAILLHKENASSGAKSTRFDYYVTLNGIRFLRKFAPCPPFAIFMMIFARAFRRFIFLEWKRGWVVLSSLGRLHETSQRTISSGR